MLKADDCYDIGKTAHFMEDYYHAVFWIQRALEKYDELVDSGQDLTAQITSTLDFLNFDLFKVWDRPTFYLESCSCLQMPTGN